MGNYNVWQKTLAHATGILAWIVSAGNLVVSCACKGKSVSDEPEDSGSDSSSSSQDAAQPSPIASRALPKRAPITSAAGSAGAGIAGVGAAGVDAASRDVETGGQVAPPGGWNNTCMNQFGRV